MKRLLLLTYFTFTCLSSYHLQAQDAQHFLFKKLKKKELMHLTPLSFFQDSRGFMWIGTETGLFRYDGYDIIAYKHDVQDSTSISNNLVWSIQEDNDKNLWIATNKAVNKYNPYTDSFTHFPIYDKTGNKANVQTVEELQFDKNGKLWFVSGVGGGGAGYFDTEKKQFIAYYQTKYNNIQTDYTTTLYIDKKDNIWLGGNEGLLKYHSSTDTFEWIHRVQRILDITDDYLGNIWFATTRGLFRLNTKGEIRDFQPDSSNPNAISTNMLWRLMPDKENRLWISTETGLNLIEDLTAEDPVFTKFFPSEKNGSIGCAILRGLFQDKKGAIWIGTFQHGINVFENQHTGFELYQHNTNDKSSLSNNTVWSFLEDNDGDFWVGMNDMGMDKFDRKNKSFQHYNHLLDWNNNGVSTVLDIYQDHNGLIWLGTWGEGLLCFDKNAQKLNTFLKKERNDGSNVWKIYQDKQQQIWAGMICEGAVIMDTNGQQKVRLAYDESRPNKLLTSDLCVWTIYEDNNQDIWLGTHQGVLRYNENEQTFTQFLSDDKKEKSLSYGQVVAFFEDSKKRFWVATHGGGLNLMNRETGEFTTYRKKDGLSGDIVFGILEDNNGNLWLSTETGITKFNPDKEIYTNYNMSHGLQGDKFNLNAYYKDSQGFMYFGGINGFNRFHPDSIKGNTFIPSVVITDFKLFNKPLKINTDNSPLQQDISLTQHITLDHTQSVFSLEFAALSFIAPELNQYAYMLEGFDKEWMHTSANRRFVTYTSLPAGEYIFKVKGSNNDGLWNTQPTTLRITILPPWWLTWWAKALWIGLVLGSAIAFYKIRVKVLKDRQKELETQVDIRTSELLEANTRLMAQQEEIQTQNELLHDKTKALEGANSQLWAQQEEIQSQNELLQDKNDNITASIRYAQTIQKSILPTTEQLKAILNQYFLIYKPKDIVSGDFYWVEHIPADKDGKCTQTFIACVDCTGHGVPGAFMSLIGSRVLTEAIHEDKLREPSEILEILDKKVRMILKQESSIDKSNQDGMDLSICRLDTTAEGDAKVIFSGAKGNLYFKSHNSDEIQILKGDKRAIGGIQRSRNPFTQYEFGLQKDDILYFSTDGIIDQSNPQRRKFGSRQFITTLESCCNLSIAEQQKYIQSKLEKHQLNAEQRDDITVIGIKI